MELALPQRVHVCEVGLRDGLQMEKQFVPTEVKVELAEAVAQTGVAEIQVTSFVHPKFVPQLADAEELLSRIRRASGVKFSALVPNVKGAERAIAARVDRLDIVISATDSHSLSNTRMPTAEAMAKAGEIVRIARAAGVDVRAGLATSLGCPFEGFPPYARVEALCATLVEEYGLTSVGIADTVGMANPQLVYRTMTGLIQRFPGVAFKLHIHNTRGMGLANVVAGMQAGVVYFDSSFAGLGGCPFAPGATGNIATEDLVHMLHEMGVQTGVDLDKAIAVARRAAEVVGHDDSYILRAGKSCDIRGAIAGPPA